jgi:hypothetical protein
MRRDSPKRKGGSEMLPPLKFPVIPGRVGGANPESREYCAHYFWIPGSMLRIAPE